MTLDTRHLLSTCCVPGGLALDNVGGPEKTLGRQGNDQGRKLLL